MDETKIINILKINEMTKNQKIAVLTNKRPILVSASAGSGKTFILTRRYLHKILTLKNPTPPNKILVLTFAKSAADEMFNRIINNINNISLKFPKNKKINNIKNMISKNLITTIDSFCYNILKENFKNLNISPNFKIVSSLEIAPTKKEILNNIFEEEFLKNKEKFKKLCNYFSLTNYDVLKNSILKIYSKSKTMPFPKEYIKSLIKQYEFPPKLEESEFLKEIKEDISNKLQQIKDLLFLAINYSKNNSIEETYINKINETISDIEEIEKNINDIDYSKFILLINNFKIKNFERNKNCNKELIDYLKKTYINPAKKIANSLKENITTEEEYLKDFKEQKNIVKYLIKLTLNFYNKLEIKKRKNNILEFSDLIIKTIKLLTKPTKNNEFKPSKVGILLSEKFEEVLVDEFQDINDSQDMLIKILSSNEKKLFLVGDLKQSIYKFRNANPSIFLNKKQKYENFKEKTLINLNENFRSRKEVTNSVNFLFGQIMSLKFGGVNYKDNEKLISINKTTQLKEYSTELHVLNNTEKNFENLEFEIKHIAKTIKKMLDEKFLICDENGNKRQCEPKDFAVLFRTGKTAINLLCEELLKLNINYVCYNTSNFLQSFEISLLISLLKTISNPLQEISLCAVLLSPMFNFSELEILKLKANNEDKELFTIFKNSKNKKCLQLTNFLEKLMKKAASLNLEELIEEITNSTTFLKIYEKLEDNEINNKNLELFLELIKKYEKLENQGLNGFLEYLDNLNSENVEIELKNNFEDENAVSIMTIHKSKGLEFPVVFVALTAKSFNEEEFKSPILITSKFGLVLKQSNEKTLTRYNTLPFNASIIFKKKSLKEEELRLLYVAMTRAKQKVILTGVYNKKFEIIKDMQFKNLQLPYTYCSNRKTFFEWVFSAFLRNNNDSINFNDENFNCNIVIKNFFKPEKSENLNENYNKINQFKIIKPFKKININKIAKISVTDILNFKNSKKQIKKTLKMPNFKLNQTPSQKGTAMHMFLQYANFKNAEKNLDSEINRLIKNEFITKKQAISLNKQKLKNFFFSKTYEIIKSSDFYEREKYFLCEINSSKIFNNKNNKILLQGIVDCVVEKNNKLILIDYKTDLLNEFNLKKHYSKQLKLYEYAIEKTFKKPVAFSIIYSINLNKSIII